MKPCGLSTDTHAIMNQRLPGETVRRGFPRVSADASKITSEQPAYQLNSVLRS